MSKKKKTGGTDPFITAAMYVMMGYIYLLVCIYPFMIARGYHITSTVKYGFLVNVSFMYSFGPLYIPTFVPLSSLLVLIGIIRSIRKSDGGFMSYIRSLNFSATDIFVGLYALSVVLSSVLSPYRDEVVWGYSGWYMGLASQAIFMFIYFAVSRLFDQRMLTDLVYASLAASAAVFIIGILQRYGLDIFDLYQGIEDKRYISTIGQPNFFSSYMIIFVFVGILAVWISEPKSFMYKAGMVHAAIGAVVLAVQDSDMAFAGLFIGMSFLFVISLEDIMRLKTFLETALVILLSWRAAGIIWYMAGPEYELEKMSLFMIQSPLMWILIAAVAAAYVFVQRKASSRLRVDMTKCRIIGRVYTAAVVLVIILLVVYIILNTKEILPEGLRVKNRYLRFDGAWGSSRGSILHDTVLSYLSLFSADPLKAFFGAGPDMFYHVIYDHVHEWSDKSFKTRVLTNAHNEWLTAFVNYGIFGGISYSGIFISAFIADVRNRMRSPAVIGAAACIIAYFSNDLFAFQQYVSTPYIFIIIGIGESIIRTCHKEER